MTWRWWLTERSICVAPTPTHPPKPPHPPLRVLGSAGPDLRRLRAPGSRRLVSRASTHSLVSQATPTVPSIREMGFVFALALALTPASAWGAGLSALRGGAARRASRAQMLDDAIVSGLSQEEAAVVSWLSSAAMGQAHLFEGWQSASVSDKRRLIEQVVAMDDAYPEDAEGRAGLTAYVAHAKELLALSATGANPFEGYSVEVPEGEVQDIGSDTFRANEALGLSHIQDAAFVLVAGGLGERLGYDGIKVELPAETLTCASFLETYITALLAMQRNGKDPSAPRAAHHHDQQRHPRAHPRAARGRQLLRHAQGADPLHQAVERAGDREQRRALRPEGGPLRAPDQAARPRRRARAAALVGPGTLLARRAGARISSSSRTRTRWYSAECPRRWALAARHGLVMNTISVPRRAGRRLGRHHAARQTRTAAP